MISQDYIDTLTDEEAIAVAMLTGLDWKPIGIFEKTWGTYNSVSCRMFADSLTVAARFYLRDHNGHRRHG